MEVSLYNNNHEQIIIFVIEFSTTVLADILKN